MGSTPALKGPQLRERKPLPAPAHLQPGQKTVRASALASAPSELCLFTCMYLGEEERGPKLQTEPTLPTHSAFLHQAPCWHGGVPDQPEDSS